MIKNKLILYVLSLLIAVSSVSIFSYSNTLAQECDTDFYSSNEIIFYNPCDDVCSTSTSLAGLNNKDYAGNTMLTEAQLAAIEENRPAYEAASTAAKIPWQLLAAVHYRENKLDRNGKPITDPDRASDTKSDGPFQIVGGNYRLGDDYSDEEFQAAANDAALFILGKSGVTSIAETDTEIIKYTLFAYNGTAGVYKDQAKALGFSEIEANNGEGSPYVMNKVDAKRDPATAAANTWGQIKSDGGSIGYPANQDYGAFVIYALLAGVDTGEGGGCAVGGGLAEGGMTLEEAEALMAEYRALAQRERDGGMTDDEVLGFIGVPYQLINESSYGPFANCTAFSQYFLKQFTDVDPIIADTMGCKVAKKLGALGGLETGTIPKPYSVFSKGFTTTEFDPEEGCVGHTGVVLGVDIASDTVIIGEAVWDAGLDRMVAKTMSYSELSSGSYIFASTDGHRK